MDSFKIKTNLAYGEKFVRVENISLQTKAGKPFFTITFQEVFENQPLTLSIPLTDAFQIYRVNDLLNSILKALAGDDNKGLRVCFHTYTDYAAILKLVQIYLQGKQAIINLDYVRHSRGDEVIFLGAETVDEIMSAL